MLLRYQGGARGMLWACQVAPGNENALRVRVYGDQGGLEWQQEAPDVLHLFRFGQPPQVITRAGAGAGPAAAAVSRIPPGHCEGYLEAFANIYTRRRRADRGAIRGREPADWARLVPSVEDGARGVRFITAAVESSSRGGVWTELSLEM